MAKKKMKREESVKLGLSSKGVRKEIKISETDLAALQRGKRIRVQLTQKDLLAPQGDASIKSDNKPTAAEFNENLSNALRKKTIMVDRERVETLRALTRGRVKLDHVTRKIEKNSELGTVTVTDFVRHGKHSTGYEWIFPAPLRKEHLKEFFPQGGPAMRDTAYSLLGFAEDQRTFNLRFRQSDLLKFSGRGVTSKERRAQKARLRCLCAMMFVQKNEGKGKDYRESYLHFLDRLEFRGKGKGSWVEADINPRMAQSIAAYIKGEIPEDFQRVPTKQLRFHFGYAREFLDYLLLWQGEGKKEWKPYPKRLSTVYREAWGIDTGTIKKKGPEWALDILKDSVEIASDKAFGWGFAFDYSGTELARKLSLPQFRAFMKLPPRVTPWEAWQHIQEYAAKRDLPEKMRKDLRGFRIGFDLAAWQVLFVPPKRSKMLPPSAAILAK